MCDLHFSLKNVSVAFRQADHAHLVLNNVNLSIARGEWIAIVGRNGSGKSTLGRVLARLCAVSRGTLEVSAVTDTGLTTQLIFQNPEAQIVGETVYEDVCFGLENQAVEPEQMPSIANRALVQVDLAHRTNDPIRFLSGGQKQSLAIADALALEAEAVVFDEATSMLDPTSRERILTLARELHRTGTTIVWITQRLEELAFAERVIALEHGTVHFSGTPEDFFYGSAVDESNRTEPTNCPSPCTAMGLIPPHTVRVATTLRRRGIELAGLPILPEQLGKAIGGATCPFT